MWTLIACWLIVPGNVRQPSMFQTDVAVWNIFVKLICSAAEARELTSFRSFCIDVQSSNPAESSVTSIRILEFVPISRNAPFTSRIDA